MWRAALAKWWEPQKIYYTKLYQELYVGLALTGYVYWKISYGGPERPLFSTAAPQPGKKKVEDKSPPGHH